jgi:hypothetical protein
MSQLPNTFLCVLKTHIITFQNEQIIIDFQRNVRGYTIRPQPLEKGHTVHNPSQNLSPLEAWRFASRLVVFRRHRGWREGRSEERVVGINFVKLQEILGLALGRNLSNGWRLETSTPVALGVAGRPNKHGKI